jgi:2',3'-cyclic-nucleotide 2'-phosphodiesterase (5'-nucleotidase family)
LANKRLSFSLIHGLFAEDKKARREKMLLSRFSIAVLLLLAAHTSSAPQKSTDETFKLIILHNNDMHARFEQTNAASARCSDDDRDANRCYGGFARVAHVVRDYRRRAAAGEIPKVLYLNAGDTYDLHFAHTLSRHVLI